MQTFLQYLKPYRFKVFLGLFFKLAESVMELVLPIIMAKLITDVAVYKNFDNIWQNGILMISIIFANILLAILGQYFAAVASNGFGKDIRQAVFYKVNSLSFSRANDFGTASLLNRLITDTSQLQNSVFMAIRVGSRAPFLTIGSFVMAMVLDFKISLIFLACIPFVALIIYIVMKKTVKMYKELAVKLDKLTLVASENLNGARVVRAFNMQDYEEKRFNQETLSYQKSATYVGRISSLLNPLTSIIMQTGIVAILIVGGFRGNSGLLESAQLTAFITYIFQILGAMLVVANLIVLFIKGTASSNRIFEVLNTISEKDELITQNISEKNELSTDKFEELLTKTSEHFLEFKDVYFNYGSGKKVLSDINFTLDKGQTLGIIGGTGSGKSTLINLIPRFYDATSGEVLIHGKNIKEVDLYTYRDIIGIVPQRSQLIKGSVRQNLAMGKQILEEKMVESLKLARAEFILNSKEGLNKKVEAGGRNFSGGERQRLTIARALCNQPQILILDDSSSALDYATDLALQRGIEKVKEKMCIVMVSQRIFSIRRADKILVLSDGKPAGLGTHSQLLSTCEIYRDIYETQGGDSNE